METKLGVDSLRCLTHNLKLPAFREILASYNPRGLENGLVVILGDDDVTALGEHAAGVVLEHEHQQNAVNLTFVS